jgi:phage-related protein
MKEESNKSLRKVTRWFSSRLRDEVRHWPKRVRQAVGRQLNKVEYGSSPDNFKHLTSIGLGVTEIRISDEGDQYRLIYVAKFEEAVYVLHAITKKKTQRTSQSDIEIARKRYSELVRRRKAEK